MEYEQLIFLGDSSIPWLCQQNNYEPVQEAATYLTNKKINKTFNGGLIVGADEIVEFTKHLFWLVRCDSAFPNVHAVDEGQRVIISLCHYGNIHFCTLDEEADNLFKEQLTSVVGLHLLDVDTCYAEFKETKRVNMG